MLSSIIFCGPQYESGLYIELKSLNAKIFNFLKYYLSPEIFNIIRIIYFLIDLSLTSLCFSKL